jgi:hypothetical protein
VKECRACQLAQPVEHFWRNKASKDGYRATCKYCERDRRTRLSEPARKKPPEGVPHYLDLPHGESVCERCNKLVPATSGGGLVPHSTYALIEGRMIQMVTCGEESSG